jgi:hypothetical protein
MRNARIEQLSLTQPHAYPYQNGPRARHCKQSRLRRLRILCGSILFLAGCGKIGPLSISFSQSAPTIDAYDFVEITALVSGLRVSNPFVEASFQGWFEVEDGGSRTRVEGFCDSEDGSVFRIRFMPPKEGSYRYFVEYRQRGSSRSWTGSFLATNGHRRGPIRIDSENPWHFVWEGTREHYFFNGTTAYWLMGWRDDSVIQTAIQRLHLLKVNRMRVTVSGRTNLFYGEPVMNGPNWTLFITPWPAQNAEDIFHPGFDYRRFRIGYWQKFDRALRFARDRDMVISLVLDMNDGRVHPSEFSTDEYRFIHYTIDRFGAFSNITWDLGDDLDGYRNRLWTHVTGSLIKEWDPYHHLATSHPLNNANQDRTSSWFDFTSFQEWSRTQHSFMLRQREEQEKLGRVIPQTNEEYGYEDHYPVWAGPLGSDSSDTLRRMAWEIAMAGGYQTTGETARRGTNIWPDMGGGWMNGRGDQTMTMLQGYAHLVDFFTSFEWWKAEPHDELVSQGNYCLAKPGELYVIYLPHGGKASIALRNGSYHGIWFDPLTGQKVPIPAVAGPIWTSGFAPGFHDSALLLQRN